MSSIAHIPYANQKVPAIPLDDTAITGSHGLIYGVVTGLFPYTEGAGRGGSSFGASTRLGRHCVMNFDIEDGAGFDATGVWLELYTLGDSDLAANDFHASGQRIQQALGFGGNPAAANQGLPDGVWAKGTLFHADGKANMPGPGVQYPNYIVFFDGTSTYTDITANMTDGDLQTTPIDHGSHSGGIGTNGSSQWYYVGGSVLSFGALIFYHGMSTLQASSVTTTAEYWNGSSWGALTKQFQFNGVATRGYGALRFTIPGDWATTDISGNLPANGLWIRFNFGAGSTNIGSAPGPTHCWIQHGTASVSPTFAAHVGGAAYHVSDDPGTQTPDIIPWGLSNWWGGSVYNMVTHGSGTSAWADPDSTNIGIAGFDKYCAVYYDAVREIASKPTYAVLPSLSLDSSWQFNTIPTAENASAHVKVWLRRASTLVWYEAILHTTNADTDNTARTTSLPISGNDTLYIIGNRSTTILPNAQLGGGPNHMQDGNYNNAGGPVSVAFLRDRVYGFGGRTTDSEEYGSFANVVRASAIGKPHQFPETYTYYVSRDDGDEIVKGQVVRDAILVFKRHSIHLMQGEPGSGTVVIKQVVNGYGCAAAQTVAAIGGACYFLATDGLRVIDGAGNVQPIPESEPLAPLFRGLTQSALHNACAAYLPSTQCYYLAVPGLQAQFSGGAGPGQTCNDGLFVYHIPTGQWAVYGGIYAASMAVVPGDNGVDELWLGDYWGEVWRFTDDTVEGAGATASNYTLVGTATSGTTSTLVDTAATIPTSAGAGGDRSIENQWLWITGGTGAGQKRKIIATVSGTTTYHVSPVFDTAPDSTSTYRIGNIYAAVEFGDLDFGDPGMSKELEFLVAHLENTPDTDNDLDAALATGEVQETGVTFEYGGAGADSTKKPVRISLPPVAGPTQRPRIAVRVADTRPRIRAIELEGQVKGRHY